MEMEEPEIINTRWQNRRRMAWVSLWVMVIMTASFFIMEEERILALQDILSWTYMSFTSIVGAYMGLATLSGIKDKNE